MRLDIKGFDMPLNMNAASSIDVFPTLFAPTKTLILWSCLMMSESNPLKFVIVISLKWLFMSLNIVA